jgi:hypothetical protein
VLAFLDGPSTHRAKPMVTRSEPNWQCDALIVASPAVGEFATELDAELGELGLRVNLHVVPTESGNPLPDSCMSAARTARLCVLLGTVKGTPFLTIMAASESRQAEVGPLTEDAKALAARIAARLGA